MGTKLGKKSESPIFKQILDLIPHSLLRASINKYKSDKSCSTYFTYDELEYDVRTAKQVFIASRDFIRN